MRMRKKTNLTSRMEQCSRVLIEEPEQWKGKWRERFPEYSKIYVELGGTVEGKMERKVS